MENLIIATNAVLPMFLMIGVGCLAHWRNLISEKAVREGNNLCFKVFMSCMLFYNIYSADISSAVNGRLIAFCVTGCLAQFFIGLLLIVRVEKDAPSRGVMLQAFFRTNFVLLGIPISSTLFGAEAIVEITVLSAVYVPLVNVLSVLALEIFQGERPDVSRILREVATNPLVIAAALGIVCSLLGVRLPYVLDSAVHSIGNAATPMALVLLGASLNFSRFGRKLRSVVICLAERLVVSPAIMVTLAVALGFRGVPLTGVLLCYATPVAVASFTMAVSMHGDADMAAELVMLSTGLSCVTLFLWILALKSLGLI